jgi:type I restriction enzyme S subunit
MDGEELVRERMLCTSRVIADSYKRSEVKTREIICAIRATIGKVLPVPDHLDGANLTQGTARISPREGIDGRFLLWAIRSAKTQREISLQSKGTTFAEITLADLRRTPVAVPRSFAEQKQVAESLDAIDGMIAQETTGLSKLQRLKTGLMQDLLTGRVSVEPLLKPQTTG